MIFIKLQEVPASTSATTGHGHEALADAPGQTADEYLAFVEQEAHRTPDAAHH